jgi:hypothetical protein
MIDVSQKIIRVFIGTDTHCGSLMGLTPPGFMGEKLFELTGLTGDFWKWFVSNLVGPFDYALWLGDTIDGEGPKDSAFHLTTNVAIQVEMAKEVIRTVNAKHNIFVYGTPYHTGNRFDFEDLVAKDFGGDIDARKKIKIGGVKFDLSHAIGKSDTPVGGDIMVKKATLWSLIDDVLQGRTEHADYLLRGHAHEYRLDENEMCTGIICPSLQLGIKKFNRYARRLSGWYSVGFLVIDINPINGSHRLHKYFFRHQYKEGEYEDYDTREACVS